MITQRPAIIPFSVPEDIGFDQIPVDGSSKIDNDLTESLEPYVMTDTVDFQTPYLAGYVADKYDVSAEESVERANQRVKRAAEDAFRDTVIGYDSVTAEDTHIQLKGGKTSYALFLYGCFPLPGKETITCSV